MKHVATKENQKESENKRVPKLSEGTLKLRTASVLAKQSREAYNRAIEGFNHFCDANNQGYHFNSLKIYLESRKNKGDKSQTRNLIKSSIKRGLLSNARDDKERALINGLFLTIKNEKPINPSEAISNRVVNHFQLKELFEFSQPRLSVLYRFLYFSASRISEAINLFTKNIKASGNDGNLMICEIKGKGSKWRWVYLPKLLIEEIKEYHHSSEGLLFSNLQGKKLTRLYAYSYLLRDSKSILNRVVTPHDLRHSFATHQVSNGESIKALSQYLGHSTTSITEDFYVHSTMDKMKLKQGFKGFLKMEYKPKKRKKLSRFLRRAVIDFP